VAACGREGIKGASSVRKWGMPGLEMSVGRTALNESYPAVPTSVPLARRALTEFAADAGAAAEKVDEIRLAASEALTNVVIHAYRNDSGTVYVGAALIASELWMLISDDGCGLRAHAHRPGLGLGLALIAQAADDFTIAARAKGGTEVRMRFDLVPAGAARTTPARSIAKS
jgi:anti-sigma regulatory factor (Ser/Thr protein kinase)